MTVWPDQPPISRRQARLSARGDSMLREIEQPEPPADDAPRPAVLPPMVAPESIARGRRAASVAVDAVPVTADVSASTAPPSAANRSEAPVEAPEIAGEPVDSLTPGRRRSSSAAEIPPNSAPPVTRREIRRLRELSETGMIAALGADAQQIAESVTVGNPPLSAPIAAGAVTAPEARLENPAEDESPENTPDRSLTLTGSIPELIEPQTRQKNGSQTVLAPPIPLAPAADRHGHEQLAEREIVVAELITESDHPAVTEASPMVQEVEPVEPAVDTPPAPVGAIVPEIEPQAPTVAAEAVPENTTNPYVHWTTMAALDDASQGLEMNVARSVGVSTGVITTHALVLPSIPESGDQLLASSLNNTGEVMVTGSIDLPRSFGSTGAHPALFDHPDVDALIDEADRDTVGAGSAPVRAIRAVSSHNSSRGVIESPGPQKSRLPFILSIVFGSVALVALGVVIASFVFQVR